MMEQLFEEIWIFSKSCSPILEINKKQTAEKNLMSSFISAIRSFCQELSDEGLKSFIIGSNKFIIKPILQNNAILVCKTNLFVKDKMTHKLCYVIAQIFEDLYQPEAIKNWNGDLSFFNKFYEKLDLYFKLSNI